MVLNHNVFVLPSERFTRGFRVVRKSPSLCCCYWWFGPLRVLVNFAGSCALDYVVPRSNQIDGNIRRSVISSDTNREQQPYAVYSTAFKPVQCLWVIASLH